MRTNASRSKKLKKSKISVAKSAATFDRMGAEKALNQIHDVAIVEDFAFSSPIKFAEPQHTLKFLMI